MKREERYRAVIERFAKQMPEAATELEFANPYQLLVAVILSAQCTDKRVNLITPALFEAFPTPQSLAEADTDDIFELIKSVSYPNNKTKSLSGMARRLVEVYGGEVPGDMDNLLTLPGVGRKTANVILSVVFDRPAMAVDTHVFRVAERIGAHHRLAHTPRHRGNTGGQHPRRRHTPRPPLANTPRAVCVQGSQARMCPVLPHRRMPLLLKT